MTNKEKNIYSTKSYSRFVAKIDQTDCRLDVKAVKEKYDRGIKNNKILKWFLIGFTAIAVIYAVFSFVAISNMPKNVNIINFVFFLFLSSCSFIILPFHKVKLKFYFFCF